MGLGFEGTSSPSLSSLSPPLTSLLPLLAASTWPMPTSAPPTSTGGPGETSRRLTTESSSTRASTEAGASCRPACRWPSRCEVEGAGGEEHESGFAQGLEGKRGTPPRVSEGFRIPAVAYRLLACSACLIPVHLTLPLPPLSFSSPPFPARSKRGTSSCPRTTTPEL